MKDKETLFGALQVVEGDQFNSKEILVRLRNFSRFIDKNLGKPFKWGAIGPEQYDCLGWALAVIKYLYNIKIDYPNLKNIENFRSKFLRVPYAKFPGDFIFLPAGKLRESHIICIENRDWGVQSSYPIGVHRVKLRNLPNDPNIEYYVYKR